MAHTVGLDVEQRPAVGPEGVADVGDRAAARAQDLPVGAAGRQQLGIEVAAFCMSAGEGDDAAVTPRGVAEVGGGVGGGVEPVDVAESGRWKGGHGRLPVSVVVRCQVVVWVWRCPASASASATAAA